MYLNAGVGTSVGADARRSGGDEWVGEMRSHLRNGGDVSDGVCVDERDDLGGARRRARIASRGGALVGRKADELGTMRGGDRGDRGCVRRPVIDDGDVDRGAQLVEAARE